MQLLEHPSPAGTGEARKPAELIIPEARWREKRRRIRIGLVVVLALAAAGIVGGFVGSGGPGTPTSQPSLASNVPAPGSNARADTTLLLWPAGPPVFSAKEPDGGTGRTALVENLGTGRHSVHVLPGIAGGDFPVPLVEAGGYLVYNSTAGVSALAANFKGPVRLLGRATYFVPAATRDQIWLVRTGHGTPSRIQPVSVASGIRGPPEILPQGTSIVRGTDAGLLLVSQRGALELWRTGSPPRRVGDLGPTLRGDLFASGTRLVAYGPAAGCRFLTSTSGDHRVCKTVRVVDLITNARLSFPAPSGTVGWVPNPTTENGLAPSGGELVASAATPPDRQRKTEAFVLSVSGHAVTPVPTWHGELYARTVWSPDGSSLFYRGLHDRLDVFQPATDTRYQSKLPWGTDAVAVVAMTRTG